MLGFLAAGCSAADLLLVSVDRGQQVAYPGVLTFTGVVVLCPRASCSANDRRSCETLVYVSPVARGFYLSCETMVAFASFMSTSPRSARCRPFQLLLQLLHRPPTDLPVPAINMTMNVVPVKLGAYKPLLEAAESARSLHTLKYPFAQQ